jgi:hypothetical protein
MSIDGVGAATQMSYLGNHCLSFSDAGSYVSIIVHDAEAFHPENFTLELWINPKFDITGGSDSWWGTHCGRLVTNRIAGGDWNGWELWFDFRFGELAFEYASDALNWKSIRTYRKTWVANEWYYVSFAFSNCSVSKFYVNGTIDSAYINEGIVYSDAVDFAIARGMSPPDTFEGMVDEVRFWNVCRTDTEISNTWFRILDPLEYDSPELTGYWRFDEGIGTTSQDLSLQHNDAMLSAPTWIDQGAPAVPEFISFLILPLFMIATLLAVVFFKKKQVK